jgi:hypothetical protein
MPQCQFPVFCCFCVSEKLHRKYSRNWTKKARIPIFSDTRWSSKMRRRGTRGRPHHTMVWAPWPPHGMVWAPGPPPNAALLPIYSPRWENLNARSLFHKTYCKPPSSSTWDREGPEALPGTLSERGITAGDLLHHQGRLRSDVWVVYLGLRVHSIS